MTEKPLPIVAVEAAPAASASAEDRKTASALASMDAVANESAKPAAAVDQDAMNKAVKGLSKNGTTRTAAKAVKVNQADVLLLVEQLELTKSKATELLKQHDGSAVKAMAAYISV
ncbi:hypothetical protein TD95_002419 [Thielaviopsis punctulata]|uniref:Nascent polypeptide-associated complex subunit alpha-like UBA domain-containing protein n=1 Tax=Thielaviopsis punctulata TaxID=72032 RepID=A0A0F4ZDE9_9PEZI|nr:hypothetical protein TD95_002419 [Thielaviopsis punctulata]